MHAPRELISIGKKVNKRKRNQKAETEKEIPEEPGFIRRKNDKKQPDKHKNLPSGIEAEREMT